MLHCILILGLASPVLSAPLELSDRLMSSVGLNSGGVSVWVMDPEGQVRQSWRADEPRQLGSVMKLVTTLAALDIMGPDQTFKTEFLALPVESGRAWRLFIRGGGDIEFKYEDAEAVARLAKSQGIRRIVSPITIDLRRFVPQKSSSAGITLSPFRVSGILPSALSLNFGIVELMADPDKKTWQASPPFTVLLPKGGLDAPCSEDGLDAVELIPERRRQSLRWTGPTTMACGEAVVRRAPLDPLTQFEWGMSQAWPALKGLEWVLGDAPSYASRDIVRESPPLRSWVRDINTFSNNVAARTLLLQIAASQGRLPAQAEDGVTAIQDWMASHYWHFEEFAMENGSGLSHLETLSAEHLGALLKYALTQTYHNDFIGSLAIPGQEGTLKQRFLSLDYPGRWHLKSGHLDGVNTLAGFYWGRQGPWIVVCLVNDPETRGAGRLQELLLKDIEMKDLDTN